ncbi:MAG: hypothetical protein GY856_39060, partial [bacterium]|nr:hypothetical protein [bacterium]
MEAERSPFGAQRVRSLLTRLTRLAGRREETTEWLAAAFERHPEELALVALDVAVETGDPIGRVLARLVETKATFELARTLDLRLEEESYNSSVPLWEVSLAAGEKVLRGILEGRGDS